MAMDLIEFTREDAEAAARMEEHIWRAALVFTLTCPEIQLKPTGPMWN